VICAVVSVTIRFELVLVFLAAPAESQGKRRARAMEACVFYAKDQTKCVWRKLLTFLIGFANQRCRL
jgi:hypothetical protein